MGTHPPTGAGRNKDTETGKQGRAERKEERETGRVKGKS